MTGKVFVDTNILVYARDASHPDKQRKSIALMEELWKNRNGRISVQVLNEYFVTVTQKIKPGLDEAAAWEDLELLSVWKPEATDFNMMTKARDMQKRYGLSWWDSLIVSAAVLSGCDRIASEDLSAGQVYDGVTVLNPFGGALAP